MLIHDCLSLPQAKPLLLVATTIKEAIDKWEEKTGDDASLSEKVMLCGMVKPSSRQNQPSARDRSALSVFLHLFWSPPEYIVHNCLEPSDRQSIRASHRHAEAGSPAPPHSPAEKGCTEAQKGYAELS